MKNYTKLSKLAVLLVLILNLQCSSDVIVEDISLDLKGSRSAGFSIGETVIRAPHDIWIDISIPSQWKGRVSEIGIVYGEYPYVDLQTGLKLKQAGLESPYKYRLTGLNANTEYFIRPYIITTNNKEQYGDIIQYTTLVQGDFTWSFNGTLDPNDENHQRIKQAFDTATWYYSNYTSIQKHVTVNYSPGTPTADANFDGWINMGSNPSYQRAGTALHEMAHTVGVGTHWIWKFIIDNDDSYYSSANADAVVRMMTDNSFTQIYGDGAHFWPFGINGAHEDSGNDFDYMMNALIVQGFKNDGLPSN